MWNICSLVRGPLRDRASAVEFLQEQNILPKRMECPHHPGTDMPLNNSAGNRGIGKFRCRKNGHPGNKEISVSMTKGTWLEKSHLSPEKAVLLTYSFAVNFTYEQTIHETSTDQETTSRETVADWFCFCREVCTTALEENYRREGKIGGPGSVVEVDEMKFGRRKYNRGRVREGQWIVGFIDITTKDFRVEICPGEGAGKRDARTLLTLIEKHVEKGTVIMTDCWKGYQGLEQHDFLHLCVNHSYNFIDPDTWANTQTIESNWRPLRKSLLKGGSRRELLPLHLAEFLWRRWKQREGIHAFTALLRDIASTYPGHRW